jgi:hypothetical protein
VVLKRGHGRLILVAAYALCAGACGNGLASGSSGNQVLFNFYSSLPTGDSLPPTARLGVLWTDLLQRQPDVLMPPDWFGTDIGDSPTGFATNIYRLPPAAALFRIDTPDGRDSIEMAFGELFVFDDADHNGAFEIDRADVDAGMAPSDRYLAGAPQAIVYVARSFSTAQNGFPLGPSLLTGYATVFFSCHGGQVPDQIIPDSGVQFVMQPGKTLPEIRTCMRTHSP